MFGPNMSVDTYWGMLFTETDFYKKVPRFIQREKQLVSFTQVAMANSLRKAALIENSSASYTLNREIILRRFKEVRQKKNLTVKGDSLYNWGLLLFGDFLNDS